MKTNLLFQYCPKLILFSADKQSVFLALRKGEADYDATFSFIGGKSETTDKDLVAGLKREKDEEIGSKAKVRVCWRISCYQVLFRKKDGSSMIVPHHVAVFSSGDIVLNQDEYAAYKWVSTSQLEQLEPKIDNIPAAVQAAQRLLTILDDSDFVDI